MHVPGEIWVVPLHSGLQGKGSPQPLTVVFVSTLHSPSAGGRQVGRRGVRPALRPEPALWRACRTGWEHSTDWREEGKGEHMRGRLGSLKRHPIPYI